MGVSLTRHDGGLKGFYIDELRLISTRRGLSVAEYKSTLAHELAHAHFGDRLTKVQEFDSRQERRADLWAANLLIDPLEFEACIRWNQGDFEATAHDLEVTKHLLKAWVQRHQKQINNLRKNNAN